MAKRAVAERGIAMKQACRLSSVSETCYRYRPKHPAENVQIADWLLRLTTANRTRGFGLCFLCLRNMKRFDCNHRRMCRICRESGLNLWINSNEVCNRACRIHLSQRKRGHSRCHSATFQQHW